MTHRHMETITFGTCLVICARTHTHTRAHTRGMLYCAMAWCVVLCGGVVCCGHMTCPVVCCVFMWCGWWGWLNRASLDHR